VSALPNQEPGLIERLDLSRQDVDRYAWAIEASGRRHRGEAAVARALREMGGGWRVLGWLARLPGSGPLYRLVARTRDRLSAIWGDPPPYPD